MIKRIIIILFIIIITNNIYSQKIEGGLFIGFSTNQIDGDEQNGFKKTGIQGGAFVETSFSKIIGVKSEIYYINKGAKQKQDVQTGITGFKTSLNYIEMSFLLNLKATKSISFDAGLAIAYLASYKLEENGYEISNNYYDLNDYDVSLYFGFNYYFTKNYSVNVKYTRSLSAIRKSPNWFNSNLSFALRYKF